MNNQNSSPTADAKGTRKLSKVSANGKWESFINHAGLKRYIPSGMFYARIKISGVHRMESLETTVKTKAVDTLALKRKQWRKPVAKVGTVADGMAKYEAATNSNPDLGDLSKQYNLRCLTEIRKSWPELANMRADTITEEQMKDWAGRYNSRKGTLFSAQFFNNSLNVFREILTMAGLHRDDNPAWKIERRSIPRKELNLPTAEQFEKMVHEVEHSGAGQSKDAAALVRFLAYSGCRISEAQQAKWGDVNWEKNHIVIHCAKRRVDSNELPTRKVPLVPAMQAFLKSEMEKAKAVGREIKPESPMCRVFECQNSLTRACKIVGCARLTHHSLRHLFATFCIEAGIDIPTVSRWLGHSDGGALAMRIYGHLREEHSQMMAQRVTFGTPAHVPGTAAALAPVEPMKQLAEAPATV